MPNIPNTQPVGTLSRLRMLMAPYRGGIIPGNGRHAR